VEKKAGFNSAPRISEDRAEQKTKKANQLNPKINLN